MTPRRSWPPEPQERAATPGKRRIGGERLWAVLHDDATTQDRIDVARALLAGTGLAIVPERQPT